jgi:hypothetical protein
MFTEPVPSNDRRDTLHRDLPGVSGAMTYIPSFIKISSVIKKKVNMGGIHKRAHFRKESKLELFNYVWFEFRSK